MSKTSNPKVMQFGKSDVVLSCSPEEQAALKHWKSKLELASWRSAALWEGPTLEQVYSPRLGWTVVTNVPRTEWEIVWNTHLERNWERCL